MRKVLFGTAVVAGAASVILAGLFCRKVWDELDKFVMQEPSGVGG